MEGRFIAFEGIDGCGKGTQMELLRRRMTEEALPFVMTREPSDSPIGALLHQIMIGRIRTTPEAIAALFVADRLDHLENPVNGILPALDKGLHVISDRYYFSSFAYQSVDLPMEWIISAHEIVRKKLRPAATVFLDVDPEVTMGRIGERAGTRELFENKERLLRTRERYFEAFARLKEEETVLVIDGMRDREVIAEEIWERLRPLFLPAD